MKVCSICGGPPKDLSEFYKNRARPDGVSSWCKACELIKRQEYYKDRPEIGRAASSRYRKNHLEKVVAENKVYRNENKDKVSQWNKNRPLIKRLLNAAKCRAKERKVPFGLKESDIIIPEFCPVLGIRLEIGKGHSRDHSFSIDSIVPELGYVPENVAVISHKANTIKSNATVEELRKVANWVEKVRAHVSSETSGCFTQGL